MKRDIILAGVGGQGILSIATVIGEAALKEGLYLKQAEVHGMSQRGGDVQSNLRLSSEPIYSDLIPKGGADIIISLEPMEALRYLPYLKPDGWIVSSCKPFVNIPNYPDIEQVLEHIKAVKNHVLLDVEVLAKEAGAPLQAANMVLLGAAIPMLGIDHDKIVAGVERIFTRKGEAVVAANIAAIEAGYENVNNSTLWKLYGTQW
ncbi:MAG: indolepyruvate oxidoreductase subunit beta [Paludibacteraceae bacterium]|nr:indolepyruvate oxidoreductase subunit beta [Paludibacteraceae bacterium]